MMEPVWIELELVLAIHDRLLVEHRGAEGLCDVSLLQSALAKPRSGVACASPDVIELAVRYTEGIVRNRPFIDGNERTGFLVGVLFLELNGFTFVATEEAAAHAVIGVAAGDIDEHGFRDFLRENSESRK